MRRLPFFLSMESCPRRCIYCHQGEITGTLRAPSPSDVERAVFSLKEETEICFFGGSFTCLPRARQKEYLNSLLKAPPGSTVRLSTHPQCINGQVLDFLSAWPVSMIELGISSLDDRVLSICNRGYGSGEALSALEMILDRGFRGGAQMMIGLPGQSEESSMDDLRRIASAAAGRSVTLRIYPCLVLKGTALEKMFEEGDYSPLDIGRAVAWSARLLALSRELAIPVQRIGLHESDSLGGSAVAGPHHPAFGELVRSEALVRTLASESITGPWTVPARSASLITGHGGYGLGRLARETGLEPGEARRRISFAG